MKTAQQLKRDINHYQEVINNAQDELSKVLEEVLLRSALQVSKRNPNRQVIAISTMGEWFVEVDDEERNPPALKAFEDAFKEGGYEVLPVVRHDVINGVVTTRHEW